MQCRPLAQGRGNFDAPRSFSFLYALSHRHVTLQKLYVFDSLAISDDSRRKVRLLAERLRIDLANVEYLPMVMQTENPYVLCMDFSLGVLNGLRQLMIPQRVSFFFFFLSVGLLMSINLYCSAGRK